MTIDEAKHKLDYMKKAYQKLIDEKVDSGKLVGDGVRGEWKAETPLDEVYKSMIDALEMAIKALEQQPTDAVDRVTIKEYLYSLGQGINVTTTDEDCISRQKAINAIDELYLDGDSCVSFQANAEGDALIGKYQAITALDDLPSVTPQPKMGRWIMSDDGLYRPICNRCAAHPWKGYIPTVEEATNVFKFCPNCGANMQEVKQ